MFNVTYILSMFYWVVDNSAVWIKWDCTYMEDISIYTMEYRIDNVICVLSVREQMTWFNYHPRYSAEFSFVLWLGHFIFVHFYQTTRVETLVKLDASIALHNCCRGFEIMCLFMMQGECNCLKRHPFYHSMCLSRCSLTPIEEGPARLADRHSRYVLWIDVDDILYYWMLHEFE